MNKVNPDVEYHFKANLAPVSKPTPSGLFLSFLTIGAFTFGGGYAMLPLIQKTIVEKSPWLRQEEFVDVITIAQSSPGPIAVNIAIVTGYKLGGVRGALASVFGAVLPSFVILLIVATFFFGVQDNRFVRGALTGMRPAIVSLMTIAGCNIGRKTVRTKQALVLSLLALFLVIGIKLHPIIVILAGACAGILFNSRLDSHSRNRSPESWGDN
ncbi:MAG TPA: chromate transporter [bacterium]|nr:chromate transporter [bacterium]